MTNSSVQLEIRDGIAHLRLNRPEVLNAIDETVVEGLAAAALQCGNDPSVRAVLLSGNGPVFCAGGDLKVFAARRDGIKPYIEELTGVLHLAISRLVRLPAPVIAAVHGSVAGGGMSLACACDLIVAAQSARFTMAYTRIGLCPDGSGSYFLPRLVGLGRALDLVLTNRVLTAEEAMDWGIVSRVVADEELMAQAEALARQLAAGSRQAFAVSKRLLHGSLSETLETQLAFESEAISAISATDDVTEGIRAFLEKRRPQFS